MDLRSGAITQEFKKQKKPKKERQKPTNKSEESMASENSLERNLKEMLTGFKEEISKQIGELRQDFEKFSTEISEIRGDVSNIRTEVGAVKENIQDAEQRIHQLEERETDLHEIIRHLEQQQRATLEQVEQLEMRSRQNNIRIYKIQEGVEGDDMVGFLNKLFAEKLLLTPDAFHISKAHRSSPRNTRPTQENPGPRSIVVRLQDEDMRQKVLQAAWSKKEIMLEETQIYFSQDFTTKTQKERNRYSPLRKLLKGKNVKTHLINPAKLKVFRDGESVTYDTPEEAEDQLRRQGVISGTDQRIYSRRMDTQLHTNLPFQRVRTSRSKSEGQPSSREGPGANMED